MRGPFHSLSDKQLAPENRNYVTLPFYCSLTTLALCFMTFERPLPPYGILIISLFLATGPNLLLPRLRIGTALVAQVAFLSLIAICLPKLSLYLLSAVSVVSTAYTVFLISSSIRCEIRRWPDILGCLIFTFFNFKLAFRFRSPYVDLTDMVRNSILPGMLNTDDSMHMAIVNMILHQFVPSTGLHMTPYLPYHYLGHVFFAIATAISSRKVYEAFYFIIPWLYTPCMVLLFGLVAEKTARRSGSFLLIPIFLFGVTLGRIHPWYIYEDHPWYAELDLTYPVGIMMILSFLLLMQRKAKSWQVFAVMSAAYFAKVSVGMAVSVSYALADFCDSSPWRRKLWHLALASAVSLASFLCVYWPGSVKGEGAFQWGAYYYASAAYRAGVPLIIFLWHQFSFSVIFSGLLLLLLLTDGRRAVSERKPLVLVWAGTAALAVVIFNLKLAAGAQFYFIGIVQWLLLPVIAGVAWEMLWHPNRLVRGTVAVGLAALTLPLGKLAKSRFADYRHYQESHRREMATQIDYYAKASGPKTPSPDERTKQFLPYYNALVAVGDYDRRDEYLVEVPESESDFWNHSIYPYPRYWMAFYIPVISGRPAWNGYNYTFMKNTPVAWYPAGAYGYAAYYKVDIGDYCADRKLRGVIRIAKDSRGKVSQTVIDCPSSPPRRPS